MVRVLNEKNKRCKVEKKFQFTYFWLLKIASCPPIGQILRPDVEISVYYQNYVLGDAIYSDDAMYTAPS